MFAKIFWNPIFQVDRGFVMFEASTCTPTNIHFQQPFPLTHSNKQPSLSYVIVVVHICLPFEEGHRAQNAWVRRNPVRRVCDNSAMYGLRISGLLFDHKFRDDGCVETAEARSDHQFDAHWFSPLDGSTWEPLRKRPGWSQKAPWYSPGVLMTAMHLWVSCWHAARCLT